MRRCDACYSTGYGKNGAACRDCREGADLDEATPAERHELLEEIFHLKCRVSDLEGKLSIYQALAKTP